MGVEFSDTPEQRDQVHRMITICAPTETNLRVQVEPDGLETPSATVTSYVPGFRNRRLRNDDTLVDLSGTSFRSRSNLPEAMREQPGCRVAFR